MADLQLTATGKKRMELYYWKYNKQIVGKYLIKNKILPNRSSLLNNKINSLHENNCKKKRKIKHSFKTIPNLAILLN